MSLLNNYTLILGSIIIIALTGFLIWWLMEEIDSSECTTGGATKYYTARKSECPLDSNYLWWKDIDKWTPWYFPNPQGISGISPNASPPNKRDENNCQTYNSADLEQMCTNDPECIAWIKASDTSPRPSPNNQSFVTSRMCYFYKKDAKFGNSSTDAPQYSCTYSPAYNHIGAIKNEYLNTNKIYPIQKE